MCVCEKSKGKFVCVCWWEGRVGEVAMIGLVGEVSMIGLAGEGGGGGHDWPGRGAPKGIPSRYLRRSVAPAPGIGSPDFWGLFRSEDLFLILDLEMFLSLHLPMFSASKDNFSDSHNHLISLCYVFLADFI